MIQLGTPVRYAMLVLAMLELVFAFAFIAGFLTPVRVSDAAIAPRFEGLVRTHAAFRSKHAGDGVTTTKEIPADRR
jgi:hypothetical protein